LIASTPEAGFPRSKRLLRGADFRRVLEQPTRSVDACFAVAAHRGRATSARLGLAVSRKALPRAVDRNRIKRIVREAFRSRHWHCCVDVVVVGRAGLKGAVNVSVRRSIEAHFERVHRRLCASATAPGRER